MPVTNKNTHRFRLHFGPLQHFNTWDLSTAYVYMPVKFCQDPLRFAGGVIREKPILSKYILRSHAYAWKRTKEPREWMVSAFNGTINTHARYSSVEYLLDWTFIRTTLPEHRDYGENMQSVYLHLYKPKL